MGTRSHETGLVLYGVVFPNPIHKGSEVLHFITFTEFSTCQETRVWFFTPRDVLCSQLIRFLLINSFGVCACS